LRVLQFLSVNDDGRGEFQVYNKAKNSRWLGLTRAMFVIIQIRRWMGIKES